MPNDSHRDCRWHPAAVRCFIALLRRSWNILPEYSVRTSQVGHCLSVPLNQFGKKLSSHRVS